MFHGMQNNLINLGIRYWPITSKNTTIMGNPTVSVVGRCVGVQGGVVPVYVGMVGR